MCSTAGCEEVSFARGLCDACYARRRRAGDLPPRSTSTEPLDPYKTWLPPKDGEVLRKLSRITGRSSSDIIRQAVSEYLLKLPLK